MGDHLKCIGLVKVHFISLMLLIHNNFLPKPLKSNKIAHDLKVKVYKFKLKLSLNYIFLLELYALCPNFL